MSTIVQLRTLLFTTYPQLQEPDYDVDVDQAQVDIFINRAVNLLSNYKEMLDNVGSYDDAIVALAGHYYCKSKPGEFNSGIVIETEALDNKTKFLVPSISKFGRLSTTKYGQDFESIFEMAESQSCIELGFIV